MRSYRKRVALTPTRLTENLLSGRQAQILYLRSQGLERKEIAGQLGISEQTVMSHIKVAQKVLEARNSLHAVSIAIRSGYI